MKITRRQFHKLLLGGTVALLSGSVFLGRGTSGLPDGKGMLFQMPYPGTIRGIWFKNGIVTTGAKVDVRLETISEDGAWFTTTLTPGITVKKDDVLAVQIFYDGNEAPKLQTIGLK